VKALLDTSVLVATFYSDHEQHTASLDLFVGLNPKTGAAAAHSLAEVYSTLTGMPGKRRVSPEHALLFLGDVRERLRIVGLGEHEYLQAIEGFAAEGVTGGAIYDALIAQCARKAQASAIYTWNVKDFRRMGGWVAALVRKPDEA